MQHHVVVGFWVSQRKQKKEKRKRGEKNKEREKRTKNIEKREKRKEKKKECESSFLKSRNRRAHEIKKQNRITTTTATQEHFQKCHKEYTKHAKKRMIPGGDE